MGSKETIIENKTGYLFKNKDPVDLANSIATVMQKKYNILESLGIEGRKNVLKKFDVDKMWLDSKFYTYWASTNTVYGKEDEVFLVHSDLESYRGFTYAECTELI